MTSIQRGVIDRKIEAWDRLTVELTAMRDRMRAEADRLVGPDRGE